MPTAASLPPPPARAPRALWLAAALLLVAIGSALVAEARLTGGIDGLPLDDAWIHLVLARSLAGGEGLAFRPGELVTASTAPLWTALLSLVDRLPGAPLLPAKGLGALLTLAALAATFRLARALELGRGLALLAAFLFAASDAMAWSALSGMEIPLFVLLATAGMALQAEAASGRRPAGAAEVLLLALAALARPEGLLLLALALGERIALAGAGARLRRAGHDLALAAAVLLPVVAAYAAIGGSPLPTTFAAKVGGAAPELPRLATLYAAFGLLFRSHPLPALLAAGGAVELLARRLSGRRGSLLPALWLVGLPLAFATLEGPPRFGNFGRYLFPLYPALAVMAAAALVRPAAALAALPGTRRRVAAGALAALVVVPSLPALGRAGGRFAQSVANVAASDLALARELAGRLDPRAVLALADIGALGYHLPNRMVDLGFLVSPDLASFVAAERARGVAPDDALLAFLAARGVDYVATFPAATPLFARRTDLFPPLLRLPVADNITMVGDELVLYATPWTRFPLAAEGRPRSPAP
ncbi:MAG TPA: hypothetical protein VLA75_04710 [Thermoanaerobaculia bacterium]|nr:hypothetical protein [Thermoanaerobaculia bacterium]